MSSKCCCSSQNGSKQSENFSPVKRSIKCPDPNITIFRSVHNWNLLCADDKYRAAGISPPDSEGVEGVFADELFISSCFNGSSVVGGSVSIGVQDERNRNSTSRIAAIFLFITYLLFRCFGSKQTTWFVKKSTRTSSRLRPCAWCAVFQSSSPKPARERRPGTTRTHGGSVCCDFHGGHSSLFWLIYGTFQCSTISYHTIVDLSRGLSKINIKNFNLTFDNLMKMSIFYHYSYKNYTNHLQTPPKYGKLYA